MQIIMYLGSILSAIKKSIMALKPENKYHPGKPSLFKTKINDKNIIALPASGCNNIKSTGKRMIPKPINWCLTFFKLICGKLKYLASNKATPVLTNSEG